MWFESLTALAYDILVIWGAIAMIVLVLVSIYLLVMARKIYSMIKWIQSGYETLQQRVAIPAMLMTTWMTNQESSPNKTKESTPKKDD